MGVFDAPLPMYVCQLTVTNKHGYWVLTKMVHLPLEPKSGDQIVIGKRTLTVDKRKLTDNHNTYVVILEKDNLSYNHDEERFHKRLRKFQDEGWTGQPEKKPEKETVDAE